MVTTSIENFATFLFYTGWKTAYMLRVLGQFNQSSELERKDTQGDVPALRQVSLLCERRAIGVVVQANV